jgi:hypothetical protein
MCSSEMLRYLDIIMGLKRQEAIKYHAVDEIQASVDAVDQSSSPPYEIP